MNFKEYENRAFIIVHRVWEKSIEDDLYLIKVDKEKRAMCKQLRDVKDLSQKIDYFLYQEDKTLHLLNFTDLLDIKKEYKIDPRLYPFLKEHEDDIAGCLVKPKIKLIDKCKGDIEKYIIKYRTLQGKIILTQPMKIQIGIKSRHPLKLIFTPQLPTNSRRGVLRCVYGDNINEELSFITGRGKLLWILAAIFKDIETNGKQAKVYTVKDIKTILGLYGLTRQANLIAGDDFKSVTRTFHRKIDNEIENDTIKRCLKVIFPRKVHEMRFEPSITIDK